MMTIVGGHTLYRLGEDGERLGDCDRGCCGGYSGGTSIVVVVW